MSELLVPRNGGRVLADQLKLHGVDTIFGVPGESYLAVLDALYDLRNTIRYVICRMEAGAANMADAYGKLTGKPGICFVTRGPGASHAAIGVHTAMQDSTPFILFIGQVARDQADREAFQEIDYRQMFGSVAKWAAQIDDASRIPEYIAHAFQVATSGRPGPVVLALPEDMLRDVVTVADAKPYRAVQAAPVPADVADLQTRLEQAERPLVMIGGAGWTTQAAADLQSFAEKFDLPVGCSFRAQDILDNDHPNYVGDIGIAINPKLAERVRTADLLLVIGPRLGEMTTGGYTLLDVPVPKQSLIHIHADADELGHVYQPDLAMASGMPHIAAALAQLTPTATPRWSAWRQAARADYEAHQLPLPCPGPMDLTAAMMHLRDVLPRNTIITNGAGNYTVWIHRFLRWHERGTQLAPTNGAMGYGVPAAIAAKMVHPEREVISINGDGCFLMCGQELATAVQYGLTPVFIVVNNGMYGTIRMHQERSYPERVSGTDLVNPDFAALARAYGAYGEVVDRTEDFPAAFERARKAGRAALIEIRIDPEALTPRASLSDIRAAALKAKA